jgi:hypothetical protein
LPKALKQMVLSLVELGWLFYKVQRYCESPKTESTCGLAARAFSAALQEELSKFIVNKETFFLFFFVTNLNQLVGFR